MKNPPAAERVDASRRMARFRLQTAVATSGGGGRVDRVGGGSAEIVIDNGKVRTVLSPYL